VFLYAGVYPEKDQVRGFLRAGVYPEKEKVKGHLPC
jgi:hypothetical protein